MSLWVPPTADPGLAARAEVDAQRRAYAEEKIAQYEHFNKELYAIDPYLELVRVREDAPDDDPAVWPGYWHVTKHNPGAPDSWMVIHGDNGEWAEPTSRIFEKLAEGDMWRDEYGRRARKRQAERAAAKEREKENRQALLAEELRDRVNAATRTFVSMDQSTPWSQNHAGRRGAGKG